MKSNFTRTLIEYTILAAFILGMLIFSSCNTDRRITRIAQRHPEAAANVCARLYPVVSRTEVHRDTVTQVLPGEAVYVDCDSAIKLRTVHDTTQRLVRVQCPPSSVKTITKDSIVVQESTAKYEAEKLRADKLQVALGDSKKQNKSLWWVVGAFALYTVLRVLARTYLKINLP